MIEALETLGELVTIAVLTPPTFQALQQELRDGSRRGMPYDVVHFDGYGAYDDTTGLDALCFGVPRWTTSMPRSFSWYWRS